MQEITSQQLKNELINIEIHELMKENPIYLKFRTIIDTIEQTMNNRTAGKIGLYCRWCSFDSKIKVINCKYGEVHPCLMKCVNCFIDPMGIQDSQFIVYQERYKLFNNKQLKDAFVIDAISIYKNKMIQHIQNQLTKFLDDIKTIID